MRSYFLIPIILIYLFVLDLNTVRANEIDEEIARMTLDQKIGQLLMIGISGKHITQRTSRLLKTVKPGAIILFKRNLGNDLEIKKLTSNLNSISGSYSNLPPLIAIDQEGGSVSRITTVPKMPTPLSVGITKNQKIAKNLAQQIGAKMISLGINMNLAPVLDVLPRDGISFIGSRSFGDNSQIVAEMGFSFSTGLLDSGVIPTSKHFPGAGQLVKDPHYSKVGINGLSFDSLQPFKEFSNVFPSAIMLSHSSYPKLDPTNNPATISSTIIKGILRDKFNYRGIILTDDLTMSGIKDKNTSLNTLGLKSLLAGSDMLMISWGPRSHLALKKYLRSAVLKNEISIKEIDAKVRRVLSVKAYLKGINGIDRTLASASLHHSLSEIDNQILNINLNSNIKKINYIRLDKNIAVTGDSEYFVNRFSSHIENAFVKIPFNSFENLKELTRISHFQKILVFVNKKRSAFILSNLPKKLQKKLVVVSTVQPGFLDSKNYLSLLNLFNIHPKIGDRLGELVSSISLQSD